MRIVAGIYGGRTVTAPKTSATRPMTDKVRAALFDSLGPIDGLNVLDCYAGSGAIGFEALSRGAEQVVAVEPGRGAVKAIRQNAETLDVDWGYSLHEATMESWLARLGSIQQKFGLIVADPPYELLKTDILEKLAVLLEKDGVLVVSHSSRLPLPLLDGVARVDQKIYGDTALSFYKSN